MAQQPQSRPGMSAAEAAARSRMNRGQERLVTGTPEDAEKRRRADLTRMGVAAIDAVLDRVNKDIRKAELNRHLLEIPEIYLAHSNLLIRIANKVLAYQHRKFVVDDNNRDILRFMLYYFNDCPLAEEVFPGRGYKLHKHIMLHGYVGTGSTLQMEIFSEYLRYTGYPGGQRAYTPADLMEKSFKKTIKAGKHPLFIKVVKGMLPKTKLGARQLNNLYVYNGAEHPFESQNPKTIDINKLK